MRLIVLLGFHVGMPNVGIFTLFNTLTILSTPAENYPFCTIEPNEARVYIPDERFESLCQMYKLKSEVAAFLEIHDIISSLATIAFNIIQYTKFVYCGFDDPEITQVDDTVDPVRDLETIQELRLKVHS
ncbi:obg-like ATPase 1 [Daucus carota subsp. sativus]|uniref:obg-like ATPase 1 n=1 Tax=Daucus carota subsp. sativus TaxID=79200 RepID=UPI0007EF6637|nr:PREDICTED: obg-like ATPase 1 [Daucus carota subsp. sativus]